MRPAVAIGAAIAALLVAPAATQAFELENAVADPASEQAGANTDLTLGFDVGEPEADLRDLTIHLPPGLVGNPLAAPMCTEAQLNSDACPAESRRRQQRRHAAGARIPPGRPDRHWRRLQLGPTAG